ncbi:hypothetical protein FDP25_12495 [Roseovarius sp. A21]|uniref:Uncharacterized protein n=1 Tax=Roseovarius bejariae TaxID=2576383 RepID=A0A844D328_9RHOB|nr:hypothetical protein [Roseovarius bejariae]MRU16253.1 hypothetical protein [Roseovarius bejariae]
MDFQIRNSISMARLGHFYGVMQTCIFAFAAITAIIVFSGGAYSAPLAMLVIANTAYGILAGNTAISDVSNLIRDLDEESAKTHFGQGLTRRNMPMLRVASSGLIGLTGLAALVAIFT